MKPLNWIQWLTLLTVVTLAVTMPFIVVGLQRAEHNIQAERRMSILTSCRDQNHRHDASLAYLRRLGDQIEKKHPDQTKSVEQGLARYKLLFDALAPKRNCQALVDKYVSQNG